MYIVNLITVHLFVQGRNFIRLGVVWAGAQPRDEDALGSHLV